MESLLFKIKKFFIEKPELSDSNINVLLIKLSIPAVIGIVITNLYNIVDSIFIGQGVGSEAIGAIAVGSPFMFLFNMCITTIVSGGISVLSISLGEKNHKKAAYCFGNSIILMIIVGVSLSVFGILFCLPLLKCLGASGKLLKMAIDYLRIVLIGFTFLGLAFVFSELIRAQGRAKEAMSILSLGAILNIIGDYIFIILFHMGIKGAAAATALSYFLSFLYGLYMIIRRKNVFDIDVSCFKFRPSIIKEMFSIGFSSLISQGSNVVGNIIANVVILGLGGNILISSIGIHNKLRDIVFMPIMGVIQGMQPIIGYNYGAKRFDKVKETANIALKYVFIIALIDSVIIGGFDSIFVRMFVNDKKLISYSVPLIRISLMFACFGAWQWAGGTICRSTGYAKKAYFFSVLRMIIVFTPAIIIFPHFMGSFGCWLSYAVADIISGVISRIYIWRFLSKELNNKEVEEVK